MNLIHRLPAGAVWGLLILATCMSWFLAEDAADGRLATVAIVLIAAIKIRMVVGHFMEVSWAALRWRLLLELWLWSAAAIVIGTYLFPFG